LQASAQVLENCNTTNLQFLFYCGHPHNCNKTSRWAWLILMS